MKRSIFIGLICISLTACNDKSANTDTQDIEALIGNHKINQAAILIKQKLQNFPDNTQLRILLAKTHLMQGQYDSAEKEFLKAQELEDTQDFTLEFYNQYAETLSLTENTVLLEKLNQSFSDLPKKAKEILVLSGINDSEKFTDGSIAKLLKQNRTQEALERIKENSVNQENYYFTYQLVNSLLRKRSFSAVQLLSEKMIAVRRLDYRPKFYAMLSSYKLNDLKKANEYAEVILQSNNNNAIANLVKSSYLLESKDFEQAKNYANQSINAGLNNIDVRIIAGIAHYQLGNYERANEHFSRIKSDIPVNSRIYSYIIATEIELGIIDSNNFTLQDSDIGALLGLEVIEQLESEGKAAKADALMDKISHLEIKDPNVDKIINMVLRSKGEPISDPETLDTILATQPFQDQQLYVSTFIAGGDIESALIVLDHWLSNEPQNVKLLMLKAASLLKGDRIDEAKSVFFEITRIDKLHIRANTFIATDKLLNEDFKGAIEGFKQILEVRYSANAMAGLIKASNLSGALDETLDWLLSLFDNQPKPNANFATDIAYIYLKKANVDRALKFLNEVEMQKNLPNRYFVLLTALLASQKKLDEVEKAMVNWKYNNGLNSQLVKFSLNFYENQKAWGKAIDLIDELKASTDNFISSDLIAKKAYFLVRDNKISAAERTLTDISNLSNNYYATKTIGFISATNSNWEKAAKSFEVVYEKSPSTENAVLLLKAYQALEDKRSVEQLANEHINKFPNDSSFKLRYAEWLFIKAPYDAITLYESMVKDNLVNINVLNNLSWLLQERGKLDEANKYINQAIKLDSSNINVVDTAITIKLKLSKNDEAVDLAADLYQSSDDNFSAGIIFVKTLIDTGDKSSAAAVLSKLKPRNSKESSIKTSFERTLKSS